MIDTHCHLQDKRFREDVTEVIKRAIDSGVKKMMVPGTNRRDLKIVPELVNKHDELYGLVGIYPGNVSKITDGRSQIIDELKKVVQDNKKIVGIGEIGLDMYWNQKDIELQKEWFRAQLELAVSLQLPVAIHSRGAEKEIKEVLEDMGELPTGQFHCFGESGDFLEYILKKGFYVSFCGNVTYPSAENLRGLAKMVPVERLLLETDSPYLSPQGKRGERNEPMNVKITGEFLAELFKIRPEELFEVTSKNAEQLYKI